ncbi:hypothetical protein MGYG_05346 [Nannizzia gypsea CBS 118893]|uniref:Uncharacterized protein n=1 Tax=Arthroderma gypseum (strain ATCC MYA-4604 / CBS 118893) TaxID=535722 RepID=E4UVM2_ARTGP|nr:hypothetical protein MGYG_05346 [Nannizzia gypsea CBS 118893]EFR02349.1 hypothetical protein MGYG_05346 [Nannizzia gypsea CBS 118893]
MPSHRHKPSVEYSAKMWTLNQDRRSIRRPVNKVALVRYEQSPTEERVTRKRGPKVRRGAAAFTTKIRL